MIELFWSLVPHRHRHADVWYVSGESRRVIATQCRRCRRLFPATTTLEPRLAAAELRPSADSATRRRA